MRMWRRGPAHLPLLFSMGFFSFGAQTLLLREHLVAAGGNELGLAAFLAAWMLAIALGALAGRGIASRAGASLPALLWLQPAALALQLGATWSLRGLAGVPATELFPLGLLVAWTLPVTLPVGLMTGALFTVAVHAMAGATAEEAHRTPGAGGASAAARGYGAEAAGSLAAGAAMSAAFLAGLSAGTALLLLLLVAETSALLFSFTARRPLVAAAHAATAAVLVTAWLAGLGPWVETQRNAAFPVPETFAVERTVDTPYQAAAVARSGRTVAVYSNGELVAAFPASGQAVEEAAALFAMAPAARRALVLGFGAEALVCQLLRKPDVEVTVVGHDGRLLDTILSVADDATRACIANPRVTVVRDDVTRFLRQGQRAGFDLAVVQARQPRTVQAARFHTVEFYRLVASRMAPDGVLSTGVTVTENVLGPATLAYARSVHATLAAVFPHVAITAGETMAAYASLADGVVTDTPETLEHRFETVRGYFPEFPERAFSTLFETGRIQERKALLGAAGPALVAHDTAPAVFLLNLLAQELPDRRFPDLDAARRNALAAFYAALLGLVMALLLGGRSTPGGRGLVLPAITLLATGFGAMCGQTLVVFGYQAAFGAVYSEFGLINSLFMLGLFVGSSSRSPVGFRRAGGALPPAGLAALLGLVCLLLAGGGPKWLYMASSLGLGLLSGLTLAASSRELFERGLSARSAAAWLEALDHLGAVAGALVGGLVLVPLAGFPAAGIACAALVAACALMRLLSVVGFVPDAASLRRVPSGPVLAVLCVVVWGLALSGAMSHGPPAPAGPRGAQPVGPAAREGAADRPRTLSSYDLCPDVEAYGGPMEVLLDLSTDGRVERVRMGRNSETPEYVHGIDRWFDTFRGKPAATLRYASEGEDGVDALTGATVTGKAAVRSVVCMAGGQPASAATDGSAGSGIGEIAGMTEGVVPLLLAIAAVWLYLRPSGRARRALLVAAAGLAGVWLNSLASLGLAAQLLTATLPPWSNAAAWGLILALLVTAVLAGPLHCGQVCPLGALQELASDFGLGLRVNPALDRTLRNVKYVVAAALLAGFLVSGDRAVLGVDPLGYLFRLDWKAPALAVLAAVLLSALAWWRPWCRYLCPLGAVLSLSERTALLDRLGWSPERVSSRCHLGVRLPGDLDCVRCNRCVEPVPRRQRWRLVTLPSAALVAVVVTVAAVCAWRAWDASRSASVSQGGSPTERAADQAPAADVSLEDPGWIRKDDKLYEFQRTVDPGAIQDLIEGGKLSGSPARYAQPPHSD